jgi:ribonuclease VapC
LSEYVLDASALIAFLHEEEGAAEVADAVSRTASISAANWAETLSKVAERGADARRIAAELEEQGLLHGLLEVVPLTAEDALVIAELSPRTTALGLSLGDRSCVALALRLGLPVLTADGDWAHLKDLGVGVDVHHIRAA